MIYLCFSHNTLLEHLCLHMSCLMTKPTKWLVRPAKTRISLGIRPVWSESSLSAWRKLGSLATHWAHSEDSDQTGRMPRLIWVFAGRTLILLVLSFRGSYDFQYNVDIVCWYNCVFVFFNVSTTNNTLSSAMEILSDMRACTLLCSKIYWPSFVVNFLRKAVESLIWRYMCTQALGFLCLPVSAMT